MKRKTIAHYDVVRRLGAGGNGSVYLATDKLLERPVVLKVLLAGARSAEETLRTVLQEARLASAIDHPNVCAIYEAGESDGEAWIAMQYVVGQSLDQVIAQGPAAPQLVLSVGIQIADGLEAAHSLGIFHRDLKPQNVMLTEGGLAKILDFGLARRLSPEEANFDPSRSGPLPEPATAPATFTVQGGTIRYMAPEQFVTGRSSVQSDVWALGVVLYELASGHHPFARIDTQDTDAIRAIQFEEPEDLSGIVPGIPASLKSAIARCLEKNPAARYLSAGEVREALRTAMRGLPVDGGMVVSREPANLPALGNEPEKRGAGILSMLTDVFREPAARDANKSIVVAPFENLGGAGVAPFFGLALADAIAARLARIPSLVVRPSSTVKALGGAALDPLAAGQRLMVSFVLAGSFARSESGFDLNWQLLDVAEQRVRSGGSMRVASLDLIAVQAEMANEVFAALHGLSADEGLMPETARGGAEPASLSDASSETYLQARAMLNAFRMRSGSRADLDRAHHLFNSVTESNPEFAEGWSGLAITEVQYVRSGFGGQMHVMRARKAVDQALKLDPASIEANLYRIYMLLSRGEKESARHGIAELLESAGNDWTLQRIAGIALRTDGMYEEALKRFSRSLTLNPGHAAILYNHRARVYHYQGKMKLAQAELEKGLALEPEHPLLRTSVGYQQMREGNLHAAIATLEGVLRDDATVRIAVPTLAHCYVQIGDRASAAKLLNEGALAAAEADNEMAYRLATYFAVEGDSSEALHWLRRAIYLGNENYPWFSRNPAWDGLKTNADFTRILDDLKKGFRRNQKTWARLLANVNAAE